MYVYIYVHIYIHIHICILFFWCSSLLGKHITDSSKAGSCKQTSMLAEPGTRSTTARQKFATSDPSIIATTVSETWCALHAPLKSAEEFPGPEPI